MDHFKDVVIRPFIEPFSEFFLHTMAKLKIAFIYLILMIIGTILELVETPIEYWVGLYIVTFCDFIFGSIRAIIEPDIEWDWHVFGRGAYKFLVYAGALIVTAVATNMYPLFALFQYLVVAILIAIETHSFFRNVKLLAVLYAALELVKRKIVPNSESFLDIIQRKDKELMKESRKNKSYLNRKDSKKEPKNNQ